eukprot:TRINITY_DN6704_c0_g1_i1.p1 TRINITY_DN6704_c0_g1~~TRINITY_DN6704_c0_g1_i1.p1  ORF type:complete len:280 (-),score=54.48 TRINITY_DN6704_c0_g1_i1:74-913(-)
MSGIVAVLQKLEESLAQGDYYHVQQMYKTLYHRYSKKKRYKAVTAMLVRGACLMIEHKQIAEAIELANLLIDHFNNSEAEVNQKNIGYILKVFLAMDFINTNNQRFIRGAIQWSSNEENNNQGSEHLHNEFARVYARQKNFDSAQNHYIRGTLPEECAEMLIEWSDSGYQSEKDLYITRAVLGYMCLKKLDDANIVYTIYTEATGIVSPLINYVKYLILTLQHYDYPVFEELREKYTISIKRDPIFTKYLDILAKSYYGVVKKQTGMGGLINTLMQSFA